jgi:hypothetical protein
MEIRASIAPRLRVVDPLKDARYRYRMQVQPRITSERRAAGEAHPNATPEVKTEELRQAITAAQTVCRDNPRAFDAARAALKAGAFLGFETEDLVRIVDYGVGIARQQEISSAELLNRLLVWIADSRPFGAGMASVAQEALRLRESR